LAGGRAQLRLGVAWEHAEEVNAQTDQLGQSGVRIRRAHAPCQVQEACVDRSQRLVEPPSSLERGRDTKRRRGSYHSVMVLAEKACRDLSLVCPPESNARRAPSSIDPTMVTTANAATTNTKTVQRTASRPAPSFDSGTHRRLTEDHPEGDGQSRQRRPGNQHASEDARPRTRLRRR